MPDSKYLSPIRKLIPFFVDSRNKWKEKCKFTKKELKRLKNNLKYVKTTNNKLKEQIKQLENKIVLLEEEFKKKQK
jgi:septal ring factor EnvC (AmiA/AmiB activator)